VHMVAFRVSRFLLTCSPGIHAVVHPVGDVPGPKESVAPHCMVHTAHQEDAGVSERRVLREVYDRATLLH
jgi:hypothetical protein